MKRGARLVHSTTDGDLREAREIEPQGVHDVVVEALGAEGYTPIRAGG